VPFQIPPDMVIGQVEFSEGGLSGLAVCNQFGGRYRAASSGQIQIQSLYTTEMGCGNGWDRLEERLYAGLSGAQRWTVTDRGTLRLEGRGTEVVLRRNL
jgi:heat shock protein HslJ